MKVIQGHNRTQRRQRQREGKVAYKYRGLPCNVRPHAEMFYVAGMDGNGGGILEWCVDREDAESRLRIMSTFPQFRGLRVGSNAEDDIIYANKQQSEMENATPMHITREAYQRAIFSVLQVIRNARAWKPHRHGYEKTPAMIEMDQRLADFKVQEIAAWRKKLRTLRTMYYSSQNTGRETIEQEQTRRARRMK